MQDEIIETLRYIIVFVVWSSFSCILIARSTIATEKIEFEIKAFRLQQYEYAGKLFGSKSWKVLYEAVSFNHSALRRCIIVHWRDLIVDELEEKLSSPIGAILIVIPDTERFDSLSSIERTNFIALEQKLASIKTELAVYFATITPLLKSLLKNIATTSRNVPSAFQQLLNSITTDNYHITSSNTAASGVVPTKYHNIIGYLNSPTRGKPYILLVAHFDSHGIVPALSVGADSNGSGIAILLEILHIFNRFQISRKNDLKYNIMVALTNGGKFSYQGSRSLIDDFNEKNADETIELAICLDALGRGNILHMHISKALSEDTTTFRFFQHLKNFADNKNMVDVVVKKINLAAEKLAWEHEIYNIRRIHAFTLSHFKTHSDPMRTSLLDTRAGLNLGIVKRNAELIANALVSLVFDLDSSLCDDARNINVSCSLLNRRIDDDPLETFVDAFATKPRSIFLPAGKIVSDLHQIMAHYMHSSHLSEITINDFIFQNVIEDKLTAHIVKPALFELVLASVIGLYLFVVYILATNAQTILSKRIF